MADSQSKVKSKKEPKEDPTKQVEHVITEDSACSIGVTSKPLTVEEIVNRALEIVFLGFNFHHPTEVTGTEDATYVLTFVNNNSEVNPDPAADHLRHGLLGTQYRMHLGSTQTQYVFKYRWTADIRGRTQTFLTSPYYASNMTDGSLIPCETVDITDALTEPDPVKAVAGVLRSQFTIVTGDQFQWVWGRTRMTDFTLRAQNNPNFYWMGVRETEGDVNITDNRRNQAILRLTPVRARTQLVSLANSILCYYCVGSIIVLWLLGICYNWYY